MIMTGFWKQWHVSSDRPGVSMNRPRKIVLRLRIVRYLPNTNQTDTAEKNLAAYSCQYAK